MRFEIVIPDNSGPELKAQFLVLTQKLTAKPELIADIFLDEDEAIQGHPQSGAENFDHVFTPKVLIALDAAAANAETTPGFTRTQVEEYLAENRTAWLEKRES